MKQTTHIIRALSALLLVTCAGMVDAARMYRWVDEQGKVHYSDHVPTEHSRSARSQLNERGLEVERTEAAKSAQEIARESELEKLRQEQQVLIERQRSKDMVLLRTFRTEDDILMARNGKLTAIDTMILIIRSNIRNMKERLTGIQQSAADLELQGRKPSKNLVKDIESTRLQLKESYASIIIKEEEKERIRNDYARDLTRFRNLKNLNTPDKELVSDEELLSLLDTVVICSDKSTCDKFWSQVQAYVSKHATTRLQMLNNFIIMTAAPVNDNDISITVSRIVNKNEPGAKIFMDLTCKNSPRGADFCKTDTVRTIQKGFQPFINEGNL
ncbi:MAG: DUF4124 domain-containing protein [Sedimenticola sp.]